MHHSRTTLSSLALLFGAFSALAAVPACGAVIQEAQTDPDPDASVPDDPDASVPDGSMPDASTSDASPPADAGSLVIGRPCATDSDCGGGDYRCQTTVPGGYCLLSCNSGSTVCPDGSICSPMPFSRIPGVCMKACANATDCRDGYVCDIVKLFPNDPNSPSSESPVCWEPYDPDAGP